MIRTRALLTTCALVVSACAHQPAQSPTSEPPVQPPSVASTYTITGEVRTPISRTPLEGAIVRVVGTSFGAISRANGTYTIRGVPPGPLRLQASLIYYRPNDTTMVLSSDTSVVFAMRRADRMIRRDTSYH